MSTATEPSPQPSPIGQGSQASESLPGRIVALFTKLANNPHVRTIALTLFYLAILLALIALYGRGNFSTPPFIYQGY